MLPVHQIESLYKSLGLNIRVRRMKMGFSQTHFANLLRISRPSMVNIEQGRQKTPLHILYAISNILNVELCDLLPKIHDDEEVKFSNSFEKNLDELDKELKSTIFKFAKHSQSKLK
ncbi:MAG: hypothetical protein COA97_05115 [Flavobacteriales bacterium]|nr:MAG: hypothetical protein COA97_05115 [Flavobacteriales bacterium]